MMKYNELDGKVLFDQDGAIGRSIHTENNVEYVRLTLQPGASIPSHEVPFAATFYIISGDATLSVDESRIAVTQGDLVEVNIDQKRGVENGNADVLELMVTKHL